MNILGILMAKCKICKKEYIKKSIKHMVCSYECSLAYSELHLSNKVKEKKQVARKELIAFNNKDINKLTGIAKKLVQHYVRLRDINEPCISCRKTIASQWDGGHFKNAKHYASIRLNTLNIHKQCSYCNKELGSNALNYRIHLIEKIGLAKVEWLENQKGICRYNAEYLVKYIRVFKKKIRQMKKRLEK